MMKFVIAYLLMINIFGFFAMGIDKWKARNHKYRISEKMLFFWAILGGSVGTLAGMHVFHHKTQHWYFKYGMPAILVLQIVCVIYYVWM